MKMNGVDFTAWEWGTPPSKMTNFYRDCCVIGAKAAVRAIADDHEFSPGYDKKGLTVVLVAADGIEISGRYDIVGHCSEWSEIEQAEMAQTLRRLADKLSPNQ